MKSRIKPMLIILIALSMTWWFGRPFFEIIRKARRLDILKAEVAQLEQKREELEATAEYYKTDDFIEKEARDKLNMVKPGEKIVIITDDKSQGGEVATDQETIEEQIPNWEKWRRLFFE